MKDASKPPPAVFVHPNHKELEWINELDPPDLRPLAAYAMEASPADLPNYVKTAPLQIIPKQETYHENMAVLIKLALGLNPAIPSDLQHIPIESLRQAPQEQVDAFPLSTKLSLPRRSKFKNRLEELVAIRHAKLNQDVWHEYLLDQIETLSGKERSLIESDSLPIAQKLILLIHSNPDSREMFLFISSKPQDSSAEKASAEPHIIITLIQGIWSTLYFGTYGTYQALDTVASALNAYFGTPQIEGEQAGKRKKSVTIRGFSQRDIEERSEEKVSETLFCLWQKGNTSIFCERAEALFSSVDAVDESDETISELTRRLKASSLGETSQTECLNLIGAIVRKSEIRLNISSKVHSTSPEHIHNTIDKLGDRAASQIDKGRELAPNTQVLLKTKRALTEESIISLTDSKSTIHKRGQPKKGNLKLANFKQFIADNDFEKAKALINTTISQETLEEMRTHALNANKKTYAGLITDRIKHIQETDLQHSE